MSGHHDAAASPAVRFTSATEEIAPAQHVDSSGDNLAPSSDQPDATAVGEKELQNLNQTLSQAGLQSKRLENFNFEVYSLPASRVPSSSGTRTPSLAHSSIPSPKHSPPTTEVSSPITPAASDPQEKPRSSSASRPPPASSASDRSAPAPDAPSGTPTHPQQAPRFTVGPAGDSLPVSHEDSPVDTPGSRTPATDKSRPLSPANDAAPERDDPYARGNRPEQSRNLAAIDPRFVFSGRDQRKSSQQHRSQSPASSRKGSAPATGALAEANRDQKRHSIFGGSAAGHEKKSDIHDGSKHGSMSELKRFLKLGHRNKQKEKEKRPASPVPSIKGNKSGTSTPPSSHSSAAVPFADDHGLESKYGKFGKVLGAGAGGSVRLLKRSSDGVTFAVKQFRARHAHESPREYNKKVTAEFCIGSTLHHGNIIETMDLINEKQNWYVVMEYAPFDLFAIVMTGKMTREEVTCSTLQVLNGVCYLHSMGLSHRDLKLDNVVVNEHGIMKIIDFGSAAVFMYPFEKDLVLASGIVGSDPYLAPEVYDLQKYDPQPADVWSLAIMYCCMTLRRFPWKAPRISDNSYKLFIAEPDPPQPNEQPHHHHHHHHTNDGEKQETHDTKSEGTSARSQQQQAQQPQQPLKGPQRLLRLLPRESRVIIGRMLEVDPKKRATLQEINANPWIKSGAVCQQIDAEIVRQGNHEHTLEPGSGGTPSNSKGT